MCGAEPTYGSDAGDAARELWPLGQVAGERHVYTGHAMSLDNLLYAARAGDAKAKRRLFKELRRELVGYFRRRVPAADVEDLTQRTLEIARS